MGFFNIIQALLLGGGPRRFRLKAGNITGQPRGVSRQTKSDDVDSSCLALGFSSYGDHTEQTLYSKEYETLVYGRAMLERSRFDLLL